jgi:replicative DNA helicase
VRDGGEPDHDAVVKRIMDTPYDGPAAGCIRPEEAMDLSAGRSEATVRGYEASLTAWKAQQHALQSIQDTLSTVSAKGAIADPSEAIASLLEKLRSVQTRTGGDINLGQGLDEAIEQAQRTAANREAGKSEASWGLPVLDNLCPLERGRLYTLAAAPKCGKTSLAMQAATATGNMGGKVAFASLEMRASELASVMACRELGFDSRMFRRGMLGQEDMSDIQHLADAWKQRDHIIIRDTRNAGTSCSDITAWIQQRERMFGNISLIVIDYLQLMTSRNPNKREYDVITDSTRMLKGLARDLNIPVLMLAQMNREGRRQQMDEGRQSGQVEPTMNSLKGSGSIEQDSDAVCFLWSEKPPVDGEAHRPVNFKLEASRFCEAGSRKLMFFGPHQTFSDAMSHTERKPNMKHHDKVPKDSEDLFKDGETA